MESQMAATPLLLSLKNVTTGQQWPLATSSALSIRADGGSQFELIGALPPAVRLVKRGNSLAVELDSDTLAVIDGFFLPAIERPSDSGTQLFFTSPTTGQLLLASDAALDAADGTVWSNSRDDDSPMIWLCVAAAAAVGGALGGGGSSATVDKTPPAVGRFNLAEDTGASDSDLITSQARIDVTLAADAASWEYTLDGGGSWQPGSGSSFLLADNASYDAASVAVRQRDAAGNLSATVSNSATIETDSRAPAAPSFSLANDSGSSASDGITDDATINVSVASDAASWQYRLQGGAWQTGSGSSFELAANTTYAVGDIELRQSDLAGNLSAVTSNSAAITTDTAVAVPSFALEEDSGSSASDGTTTNGTINVTLASDAASWQYRLQGDAWQTGSGSSFELAANTTYAVGDIELRQSDMAGNLSAVTTNSVAITTDNIEPDRPEFSLAEDTGLSDSDKYSAVGTINVTLASDAASWEYYLDGFGWQPGSGSTFELPANSSFGGGGDIQVRQTDLAGNRSPERQNSERFTTDTLAPSAPSFALASDSGSSSSDGITNNTTVDVTLAGDMVSWEYRLQGGEWQSGSGSSFELAANTSYASGEIAIRQTDMAGNLSAISSNSSAITIDTALPSRALVDTTFVYSAVPAIDAPLPQYISGQATLAAGEQLNVTIGSQLFSDVAVSDGNWQIDRRSLGEFSGGESIEVTATVVDVAGNQITDTSSAEITVQYNDRVIFDLTTGQSSEHGVDRSFATDIDYNIFIIVDSDGVDMRSIATEQQWRSWNNLGSGDTIWLVGNNPSGEVIAFSSGPVTTAVVSSSALIWASKPTATSSQQAVLILSSGVVSRAVSSQSQTFQLFNSADGRLDASGGVAVNYLATIHAGSWSNIYTTQGLS
jgi:hypothetical protein